jgi:hypothetical protein
MACVIKPHFTCDGTGQMCDRCGESPETCGCEDDGEEPDFVKCEECDGAGRFCVTHESPCGDLSNPPRCDKAQAEAAAESTDKAPFRPYNKTPCKQCPFRKTAMAGWLGAAPPEMFIGNIMGEVPSPCHSSINYDKEKNWEEKWRAGKLGKLCTGALIMAANSAKQARDQRMLPVVPPDKETVFETPHAFLAHHNNAKVKSWKF